jgi:glucodextranase-like protein
MWRMGRFAVFLLALVVGAGTAWASRAMRTSEADLLPLVTPSSRAAPLDELEPAPLALPKEAPPAAAAPEPAPAAAPTPEVSWKIAQAQSVLRLTPDGDWVDVAPGAPLAVGDQLRTREHGKLVLASAAAGQISVGPLGRVALRATVDGAVRLRCSDGVLDAAPKGGALAVELRAGEAIAEGSSPFTALCGADRAYVFAAGGQVEVSRGEAKATLDRGEVATIPAFGEVVKQKLPPAVELTVEPPKEEEKVAVINGHVSPGTRVRVGEVTAEVDGKGQFSARYPLKVGENKLTVQATDLAGHEKSVALAAITLAAPPKAAAAPKLAPVKPAGPAGNLNKSKGGFTWGGKK